MLENTYLPFSQLYLCLGLLTSNFKAVEVDEIDGMEKENRIHIDHESFYDGRVFGERDSKAQVR